MIEFGIVGTAWRAEFFLRIAQACPDRFRVVGLVGRNASHTAEVALRFGVPAVDSVEALVQAHPEFIVTSVTRGANLALMQQLAALNMPILSETPPAESVDELIEVAALVKSGARIQVAEQFHLQPHHAARLAFAASGKMGTVSEAQISVSHGYHGISLMRHFLNILFEPVTINAYGFASPIVEGAGRGGLPPQENIITSLQTIVRFDFGDRLGVYDFTGDQYFSFIRGQRVLVRGERGEIVDERAVYLQDFRTPIHVTFARQSAGINGNLEGHYLKGIQVGEQWVYQNPLAPAPLSDEEIAVGSCLLRMSDYVRSGEDFYPAVEACQDRYLEILVEQSLAENRPITAQPQAWQR
jgi:Oxidoreductase family, NAD-binding Rossmann fold